jgi:Flp pilus assembly protein TadD
VGFATGVSPWTYFLNQLPIIARYLWLVIWPRPLVVDYGLPRAIMPSEVIVPGILVVALGVATLFALRRHKALGFLGVWFFVTLAPTSSVVPIAADVGAERRMYLPLMALVVLAVVGVYRLLVRRGASSDAPAVVRRGASLDAPASAPAGGPEGPPLRTSREGPPLRIPIAVLTVVCVLLAAGVMLRTREYQSVRSIAQANVDRYPHGRSRLALASELVAVNEHSAALQLLEAAIADYPQARLGLATELAASGRLADAVVQAREFIRLLPDNADVPTARDLIGRSLALQGQYAAAAEEFRLLAEARPNDPAPRVSIGNALLRQARANDAIASYEAALRLKPGDPDILLQLGLAYGAAGRRQEATMAFESAAAGRPDDLRLLNLWGRSLAAEGRYMDAVAPMRRVVELAPSDSTAIDNLRVIEDLASRQRAAMPGPVARP